MGQSQELSVHLHTQLSTAPGPLDLEQTLSPRGGILTISTHSYKLHLMTHFFQIILDVAFHSNHLLEDLAYLLIQSITSLILAKHIHIGKKSFVSLNRPRISK